MPKQALKAARGELRRGSRELAFDCLLYTSLGKLKLQVAPPSSERLKMVSRPAASP